MERETWERKICWMMQRADVGILIKVYKYMWMLILERKGYEQKACAAVEDI